MKKNIGFIGLGLMGEPMAFRILRSGFSLSVYNRTREKALRLLDQGAQWCDSPREVASKSEVVLSMISNSEVLETISMGSEGIISGLAPGGVHVDTSTVSPTITKQLAHEYAIKGLSFIHSPVLGSIPQAAEGSLLLFVGGADNAFARAEDVLKVLGSKMWRFPRVEQATHTKLLCNFFIATMISTLSQALVFAKKADIGPRTFLEILANSALNAPMYQTKGVSIIERNFAPRFFLEHMMKDINLLLDAAKALGVVMPSGEIAQALFSEATNLGLIREDYSAVVKVMERIAGVEVT